MLTATLTYNTLSQEVTLTDSAATTVGTYRLVEVSRGESVLATMRGLGASAVLRQDGVYKLVLQLVEVVDGTLTIVSESEIVYHLQLAGSICREASLYSAAIKSCSNSFREALCERYNRQKAVLAYCSCNVATADKLLRGGCAC